MGNFGDGGQMERESKVGMGVRKTPDQLKSQIRQTNVFRITKEEAEPFGNPLDESISQVFGKDHPDYSGYLASLRALRRFQKDKAIESGTNQARFYDQTYDPNIARLVLDHLLQKRVLDRDLEKSPDRVSEISGNEATFNAFLKGGIRTFYFPLFENSLPEDVLAEGLRDKVNTTRQPYDLKNLSEIGFEKLSKYVPKEDIKRAYQELATGQREPSDKDLHRANTHFLGALAGTSNLEQLFTQEELYRLSKTYIESNTSIFVQNHDIPSLLEKGILDQALIKQIIFQDIKDVGLMSTGLALVSFVPDINRQELHNALRQAFLIDADDHQIDHQLSSAAEYLSKEDLIEIMKRRVSLDPNLRDLETIHQLGPILPDSVLFEIVQMAVNDPRLRWFGSIRSIITESSNLTPDQRHILFDQLLNHWEKFVEDSGGTIKKEDTREVQVLFEDTTPLRGSEAIKKLLNFYPEQERATLAQRILSNIDPDDKNFREKFDHCKKYLNGEATINLIRRFSEYEDKNPLRLLLYEIDEWADNISGGEALQIAQTAVEADPEFFIHNYILHKIAKKFSPDNFKTIALHLAFENPFVAFEAANYVNLQIDGQAIVDQALTNEQVVSLAPKYLRDLFRQTLRMQGRSKALYVREGLSFYRKTKSIIERGLEGTLKSVLSKESLTSAQEQELVNMFYSYSIITGRHPEIFEGLNPDFDNLTFSEVKDFFFKVLDRALGRVDPTSLDQMQRFLGAMGSVIPFLIYSSGYAGFTSEKNLNLLRDFYESAINGNFRDWKFDGGSEVDFENLKRSGLLPQNLTFSQYGIWQQDEQTTLYDALSVDSTSVAQAINQYMKDNIDHLGVSHIINMLAETTGLVSYEDLHEGIQQQIRQMGQHLHEVNLQLNQARKEGKEALIENHMRRKSDLEKIRGDLLRARSILRLLSLSADEVSVGTLLEGKDKKQKGDSLFRLLDEIEREALPDDRFVYQEVKNLLRQAQGGSDIQQNLYSTDSSDPKITFEIGENPVVSCQSYDGGELNECLLGYTDPNTKILIIRNERGNLIARSIFRLLTNSQGIPTLHVERIYSAIASGTVPRVIYTHALKKAEEIGIPVVVSKRSQTEAGATEEALTARDFSLVPVAYNLQSFGSRAPRVYVDSAGGSTNGEYKLDGLLEIRPTTQT